MVLNAERVRKLLVLNLCIAGAMIVLFSDALLGLRLMSGSAFSLSLAWTAVVVGAIVFVVGNRALLREEPAKIAAPKQPTLTDSLTALHKALDHGDVFDDAIKKNIEQVRRFVRKRDMTRKLLEQKFSVKEISYEKFAGVLRDVEKVLQMNIGSILNKIYAFDVDEYEQKPASSYQDEALRAEKQRIYHEYIDFVNGATKTNEDILLKLDKILLELSRYDSLEESDVQKLPAMMEMDELIRNANRYK